MQVQRNPNSFRLKAIRPLERADLAFLQQKSARQPITNLRDSHHILARYIASGMTQTEAARVTGRSISAVCNLVNSPAMQELIASYRAEDTEAFRTSRDEYYETIFSNGLKAARQISEQLDAADEPDSPPIPISKLLSITADSADRVGYTKKSTQVNLNVDFAARLEAARRRSIAVLDVPAEVSE